MCLAPNFGGHFSNQGLLIKYVADTTRGVRKDAIRKQERCHMVLVESFFLKHIFGCLSLTYLQFLTKYCLIFVQNKWLKRVFNRIDGDLLKTLTEC